MQHSREHFALTLRLAGFPEVAEEARRALPDPVEEDQIAAFLAPYGITLDERASGMGGPRWGFTAAGSRWPRRRPGGPAGRAIGRSWAAPEPSIHYDAGSSPKGSSTPCTAQASPGHGNDRATATGWAASHAGAGSAGHRLALRAPARPAAQPRLSGRAGLRRRTPGDRSPG